MKILWEILSVLGQVVWGLFKSLIGQLDVVPTNLSGLFENLIKNNWMLTGNTMIDGALLLIASIISSGASFYVTAKVNKTMAIVVSLIVLIGTLWVFESLVFWIILGVIVVVAVIFAIISRLENKSGDIPQIVQSSDEVKVDKELSAIEEVAELETCSIYDLWHKNGNKSFKAYNTESSLYVYISQDPAAQYKNRGTVQGSISYNKNTYHYGRYRDVYYASHKIWKIV